MPTIIDSLLVTLGLDASSFNAQTNKVNKNLKDTGAEAEKTGAKIKKSGKDGAEGFSSMAVSAAKFLAALGGTVAIKRFAEQLIEADAALNRLSQNLNVGVSTISAWSNAAELAGGSSAGLQGTMDMLSKAQTQLKLTGESSLIPYFSALGLSLSDASGKALPLNDILLNLSEKLSKLDRTTAFNIGRMMGIDEGTLNLLLKGRSEVELLIKRQKESNAVTKQQAEEASRLKKSIVESKQSFEAFGRELLSKATPALEKIFTLFENFGKWINKNQDFVQDFLLIVATGLSAIALASIPINLTVLAVLSLAAAIAALLEDYQTWKRGGDSLIDWSKWEPGIKFAIDGLKMIRDYMADILYVGVAGLDTVGKFLSGDRKGAKVAAEAFWVGRQSDYNKLNPTKGAENAEKYANSVDTKEVADKKSNAKREQSAMAYFQAQGWSKDQSAGIVANIKAESSLNHTAVGDGGKAYGIAQWHPDRQENFKKAFGKDIKKSTFEDQLAFIQYELTQGTEKRAGGMLRDSKSASGAAAAISTQYERPRDIAGEAYKRGQLALGLMQGTPNASHAALGAGASMVAQARAEDNRVTNPVTPTSNSLQNNIGEVKIYTAATDANGIAKDMGKSLDYLFTSQANYGLF